MKKNRTTDFVLIKELNSLRFHLCFWFLFNNPPTHADVWIQIRVHCFHLDLSWWWWRWWWWGMLFSDCSRFPAFCLVKTPSGWAALFPGREESDVIGSLQSIKYEEEEGTCATLLLCEIKKHKILSFCLDWQKYSNLKFSKIIFIF